MEILDPSTLIRERERIYLKEIHPRFVTQIEWLGRSDFGITQREITNPGQAQILIDIDSDLLDIIRRTSEQNGVYRGYRALKVDLWHGAVNVPSWRETLREFVLGTLEGSVPLTRIARSGVMEAYTMAGKSIDPKTDPKKLPSFLTLPSRAPLLYVRYGYSPDGTEGRNRRRQENPWEIAVIAVNPYVAEDPRRLLTTLQPFIAQKGP